MKEYSMLIESPSASSTQSSLGSRASEKAPKKQPLAEKPRMDYCFQILGVAVHAVQIPDVIFEMVNWIRNPEFCRYIAVTGMHGLAESSRDQGLRTALNSADLVVPDGMPLVWLARWYGHNVKRRVYGPELMEAFCEETGSMFRHFFYGGNQGVAEELAESLQDRFAIQIAGTYTPPFRALTDEEEEDLGARVKTSRADIVWVGLSTPKQEKWMLAHRDSLPVAVMLGVGAAFDINSGNSPQAPRWMREHGLEWLFRLLSEPRRLWRRYLVTIPKAAWLIGLELVGLSPIK
jgi:N-acetylglucosaminyldiphosphoundecaprenol N-acetyl-beta-D-mannosaminyltransferase